MISDYNQILTKDGWKYPSELANESSVRFVCPRTGITVLGEVVTNEPSDLYGYSLCPRQNTSGMYSLELFCGRPQRMFFADRDAFTLDMRKGDRILPSISDIGYDAESWGKGFLYAIDALYLHTDIIDKYPKYRTKLVDLYTNNTIVGPPVIPYNGLPVEKSSFISGYLSGSNWPNRFKTANSFLMDFFLENAGMAGIVITGQRAEDLVLCSNSNKVVVIHNVTYGRGIDTEYFRVMEGPIACDNPIPSFKVYLSNGGVYTVKGGWTLGTD